jgi:hypothetical protein
MAGSDTADARVFSMSIQDSIASYRRMNEALEQQFDSCHRVTRYSMELLEGAQGANARLLAQNHLLKTVSEVLGNQSQSDCQSHRQSNALQRFASLSAKAPSPCQQPNMQEWAGIQSVKGQGAHSAGKPGQQPNMFQLSGSQVAKAQAVHSPGLPRQQPNVRQWPGMQSAMGQSPQPHQQSRRTPLNPDTADLSRVISEVVSLGGPQALLLVLRKALEPHGDAPSSDSEDSAWEECD